MEKSQNKLKLFENKKIRYVWNDEEEDWYFSVVDVCYALSESESSDMGAYWRKLKQRLKAEGSEVVTNCHGLKIKLVNNELVLEGKFSQEYITLRNFINEFFMSEKQE